MITPRSRSAFTLVEMLVSIAVLVLIMTFIGQMMSSISLSTTLSNKHIDTDNQARIVFDRMAMDFAGMPHRRDIEYLFAKEEPSTGSDGDPSDKMFFYSQAPAYFSSSNDQLFPAPGIFPDPKSNMALIGYCINTGSNNNDAATDPAEPYFLQRLGKGLTWDNNYQNNVGPGGLMSLTFNPAYNNNNLMISATGSTLEGGTFTGMAVGQYPSYGGRDPSFDTIGSQVFRLEFCFQVKDLTPVSIGGLGGTVFSNYPVAVYTDTAAPANSANTTFVPTAPDETIGPPPTGVNPEGPTGAQVHVGDRWFDPQANVAFVCTAVNSAGTTWVPNGLADVKAIVVAIAVMDINSRKTLNQMQLASAASHLPDFNNGAEPKDPSPSVTLMATAWQNALDGKSTNTSGQPESFTQLTQIPQAAASQIRVYQRFFYLNNN